MCCDLRSGSRFCAIYSVIGVLFMLWVGIMLSTQPFYVVGIEDVDASKETAFGAMGMFVVTFCGSICGMIYECRTRRPEVEHAVNMGGGTVPEYRGEYSRVNVDHVELSSSGSFHGSTNEVRQRRDPDSSSLMESDSTVRKRRLASSPSSSFSLT